MTVQDVQAAVAPSVSYANDK